MRLSFYDEPCSIYTSRRLSRTFPAKQLPTYKSLSSTFHPWSSEEVACVCPIIHLATSNIIIIQASMRLQCFLRLAYTCPVANYILKINQIMARIHHQNYESSNSNPKSLDSSSRFQRFLLTISKNNNVSQNGKADELLPDF